MKISQFRALIKEEVRKVIKESKTTRRTLKEGVIEDLQVEPKTIGVQWEEAENLMDYVKAKHKLGPKKYVAGEGGDVEIYKIGTTPYILVDEDGFGAIFKAVDSAKVISAIKDGSYFDWNESVVSQKPLKEAAPKSGQTIDDWDLTDSNMIKPAHQDTWLELLSDVPNGWVRNAARKAKVLQMANAWLSKNGYKWSVADAVSQDEDGVVTWKIGGVNESFNTSAKRKLKEVKTVNSTADFDEYEDFEANKALNIQGDHSIDFYLKGVEDKWEDGNEGQLGAIKDAGFKLTLLVKVEMEGLGPRFSGIEVYKVNGQPYIIVSEVEIESASLFKASDLPKVLKALGVN